MEFKIDSYPHVAINTTALKRSSRRPAAEDTTVLFAPFVSKKGPSNVVVCHTLSEFVDTFGELDYEVCKQQALNIYNWLSNGGTVYAKRLTSSETKTARWIGSGTLRYDGSEYKQTDSDFSEAKINNFEIFQAKYPGVWYADLNISVDYAYSDKTKKVFNLYITHKTDTSVKEILYKITKDNFESVLASSQYIVLGRGMGTVTSVTEGQTTTNKTTWSGFIFDYFENLIIKKLTDTTEGNTYKDYFKLDEATEADNSSPIYEESLQIIRSSSKEAVDPELQRKEDGTFVKTLDANIEDYFKINNSSSSTVYRCAAEKDIGNHLETPIDIILDAGFARKTKSEIAKFNAIRNDIVYIFDCYDAEQNAIVDLNSTSYPEFKADAQHGNIAIYEQTATIYDAIFNDKNITVAPSYFLSKLIPFNDLHYGIQLPVAGLRRGILEDALAINENPIPDKKAKWFQERKNYIEKTSREYAFMSQRTHDGSTEDEYTALSFLNNVRCVERMKKDIERLAREYLFEFNDSVTLSQLSNVLNKYIGEWISNRTLTYGVVEVAQDDYSSERVNVTINMRFTGTIEIIAVDITIE